MINRRLILVSVCILAVLVSFIFLYERHFLSGNPRAGEDKGVTPAASAKNTQVSPVKYTHLTEVIGGSRQEIDLLEIAVDKPGVKISPVLSFDLIYGFEKLSDMVLRKKAYAGVNAGFFYEYGLPSGMVVIDGKLIAASSGKHPVFTIENGKAGFSEVKSGLWLEYGGKRLKIDNINTPSGKGGAIVYTPVYGSTNRAKTGNLTITVKGGLVVKTDSYPGETEIPGDGMLVTFYAPTGYTFDNIPLKKGEPVKLVHEPDLPADTQAYECGSWIVRNGRVVIGDRDEWVGVLTNRDPRTAIGVKENGVVVLMTVDGRQPGYSAGLTGRELGEFLLAQGVNDAAMLDGGASTEMIVEGRIVNKPSFKGQERPLGGGIVVELEK